MGEEGPYRHGVRLQRCGLHEAVRERQHRRHVLHDISIVSHDDDRTAMASAAIFVGVLGVVTLTSMGDLLVSQLKGDLKEEELPMQAVFVSAPSGAQLDNASFLDALDDFPGVTRVEGRAVRPLSWKLPGDAKSEDGFIIAAWEPFEQIELTGGRTDVKRPCRCWSAST